MNTQLLQTANPASGFHMTPSCYRNYFGDQMAFAREFHDAARWRTEIQNIIRPLHERAEMFCPGKVSRGCQVCTRRNRGV